MRLDRSIRSSLRWGFTERFSRGMEMGQRRAVPINVNLISNATKPGGVEFDPQSSVRVANTKSGKHKFVFENHNHDGFRVEFNIHDNGQGYCFPSDPDDAM